MSVDDAITDLKAGQNFDHFHTIKSMALTRDNSAQDRSLSV
jgi:hypothetical protein